MQVTTIYNWSFRVKVQKIKEDTQSDVFITSIYIYNFIFNFFWHKLNFQLQREPKIQPTRPKQRIPSENQETILLWGLSFQIITKLLRVTIRPLIPQFRSNLVRMSCGLCPGLFVITTYGIFMVYVFNNHPIHKHSNISAHFRIVAKYTFDSWHVSSKVCAMTRGSYK